MVVSSSGLATACFTASSALSSPLACTDTDMCDTLVLHNGLNICKVEVDQCRQVDQVGNTLNCLLQYLVCLLQMPPALSSVCLRSPSSLSFGITISVSTFSLRRSIPASALFIRVRASKRNGFVTTPTVRMPMLFCDSVLQPELRRYRYRRPYRR